jgi:hypothetical protein
MSDNQNLKKGDVMSQVLIKHKVNDYAVWKDVFDNFADFRKSSGEKSYRILYQHDDPNDLMLLFDWDTQENAETFLASNELKSAMREAGVAEAPKIEFFNEAANGSL